MCSVWSSEAADPRDKVFRLLSLLREDAQICQVDYRKTVHEVYMEAAIEVFKHKKNLKFLLWGHNRTGQEGDSE